MPAISKVNSASRAGVSLAVAMSSDVARDLGRVAAKKETPTKFV
jgi:hypothetical protein